MKIALIAPEAEAVPLRALNRELARHGHRVSVHSVPRTCDANLLGQVPALRKRLRRDRPDVVHAVQWTGGLAALAASRGLGIPVVATFGSLAVAERLRSQGSADPQRLRLEPAIGRSASAVLAGHLAQADELARIGVPRTSVRCVPVGVDTTVFTADGPPAPRDSQRPRLVALTGAEGTAGATERDALLTLTQAMTRVPGADLVVCAEPERATERAALLRSADIVVTTCCYEPSGRTTLEAMACGKPVLAPPSDGHLDAMVDGTTGMLVAPGKPGQLAQRIRQLLAHPVMLTAYGVAAVDRVRSRYAWTRIAAETEAVYGQVTGQPFTRQESEPDLAAA